jgi:putative transposase
MSKSKNQNVRAYNIKTYQNQDKNNKILTLYDEYKKYYKYQTKKQYRLYQRTGYLNRDINTKKDQFLLSERYRRNVVYQVCSQMQSWVSNRDNNIKDIIHNCKSLSDKEKRILHIIRRSPYDFKERKLTILHKEGIKKGEIKEEIFITKKYIQIYKSILRSVKWRLPSNKNIGMQLNKNVIQLVKIKKNHKKMQATNFDYWFELSTLVPRKKVYIPSKMNSYLEDRLKEGKLCNSVRIDFKNNDIKFNLMIDKEQEDYESKIESIGIDFGTKHLFALSTGNIFGVNFGNQLKAYDNKITLLQKRLQHQGIKPNSSKRYRRLVFKCREFIKNEINRNFNKIIKELKPQEIVLERLDFRYSKLNKTMNRILRKCGRSVVKSKLQTLEKDYGITITEVNPAYTSQECKKCGFVHRLNRNNRDNFKCKNCNYTKHADINASKNIETRSSCPLLKGKSGKRTIKKHLFAQFKKNILQCHRKGSNTFFASPNSRAIFLDFKPKDFQEFYELKSGNKLKV